MKKIWLFIVSLLMMLALLGCNAFVPHVTPSDSDAFLYHYEVVTSNPTVGEEITIIATVTNETGYDYWIRTDKEVCQFGSEDMIYSSVFDRTILFSNHEILTSTHQITYEESGIHQVSVYFQFGIDNTTFECLNLISIDVMEPTITD